MDSSSVLSLYVYILKFPLKLRILYLHPLNVSLLIPAHAFIPPLTYKCKKVSFLAHCRIQIEGKRVRLLSITPPNIDVLEGKAFIHCLLSCTVGKPAILLTPIILLTINRFYLDYKHNNHNHAFIPTSNLLQ